MDVIYDERIKLFATCVNSIGMATFAVWRIGIFDFQSQRFDTGAVRQCNLYSGCFRHTLRSKQYPDEDETMTTFQTLWLLVMPVSAIIFALGGLYIIDRNTKGKTRH